MKPYAAPLVALPRLATILGLLLLVGACASAQHRTARRLDDRLQDRLAPDLAAGTVALQPLPAGARVTLLGASQFPNDVRTLDNRQRDVRASIIEALLDPSLMRIAVTDTSGYPDYQRQARVQEVRQYIVDNGLGQTLQPDMPPPSTVRPAPAGLTITIGVQCRHRHSGPRYHSGVPSAACD